MDLKELTEKIELPGTVKDRVLSLAPEMDPERVDTLFLELQSPEHWESGYENMKSFIQGDDPDGLKILSCMLLCALKSLALYRQKGIGEDIFIETIKHSTRTLNENRRFQGRFSFDTAWWFPRHLSLYLFRIGALEYEMYVREGEKMLSIHIPSDADMSREGLRDSWLRAREFFAEFYPQYAGVRMFCFSWLLAPVLQDILPGSSRIIGFQSEFAVSELDKKGRDFLKWIFGSETMPFEELPETSSLQRKVKSLLLSGETVGDAFGILNEDPWRG